MRTMPRCKGACLFGDTCRVIGVEMKSRKKTERTLQMRIQKNAIDFPRFGQNVGLVIREQSLIELSPGGF